MRADTGTLLIPVDSSLVKLYEDVSAEDKQKVQELVTVVLRGLAQPQKRPLSQIMDEISDKAQARGLTPEILESIMGGVS